MEYLSTRETAQRWGVSLRNVQRLLNEGRIPGARKYGASWLVPADAEKPDDPRRARAADAHPAPSSHPCAIIPALHLRGGDVEAALALCRSEEERALLTAHLSFMRGDAGAAGPVAESIYREAADPRLRLGGGLLLALCAMCAGDAPAWKGTVAGVSALEVPDALVAEKEFVLAAIHAGLHGQGAYPAWFEKGDFSALPDALFPAACWVYVSMLQSRWQALEVLTVAEPLICACRREKSDLCEIYLRLIAACACREHGDGHRAQTHIDAAIALAKGPGLLEPFIEYRRGLMRMLDARLKALWPEALPTVRRRMPPFFENWTRVYNEAWDMRVAAGLTPREYEACALIARGMSVNEIAYRMGISINSVKKYLSTAYGKLGIRKKEELAPLIKT